LAKQDGSSTYPCFAFKIIKRFFSLYFLPAGLNKKSNNQIDQTNLRTSGNQSIMITLPGTIA
jgi:hypothetical protein